MLTAVLAKIASPTARKGADLMNVQSIANPSRPCRAFVFQLSSGPRRGRDGVRL